MKAIIMAGGYGTRLGKLGEKLPKPLLEIKRGETALDRLVNSLRNKFREEDIIVVTNQKFYPVFEGWKKARGYKIKIIAEPHRANEEKFGTIGGLHWTLKTLNLNDDVLVVLGDNVFEPFSEFLEALLGVYENGRIVVGSYRVGEEKIRKRFGNLLVMDSKVLKFIEKPEEPISPLAAIGIYIFPKETNGKRFVEVLEEYLEEGNPDAPGFLLQFLVSNGYEVHTAEFRGRWWDIGKIEDLEAARMYFGYS